MAQQIGFFQEDIRTLARTTRGEIVYYPAVFDAQAACELFDELLATTP